jgi:hypothetical protein
MTELYEECPNGCSSAGEVWNGEGLVLCPTCKGDTTVAKETIDAPDRLWVDPTGVDELDMYVAHASDTMDYLNMDVSYTRTDSILSEVRANIPPLVWEEGFHDFNGTPIISAKTPWGSYVVQNIRLNDGWQIQHRGKFLNEVGYGDEEEAKYEANERHRDLIMIALTGEKT